MALSLGVRSRGPSRPVTHRAMRLPCVACQLPGRGSDFLPAAIAHLTDFAFRCSSCSRTQPGVSSVRGPARC